MPKYYVIEECYAIEDFYKVFYIKDNALFETQDKAKEYLSNYLKNTEQRNGRWEESDNKLLSYSVELYESSSDFPDVYDWDERDFLIRELTLL